MFGKLVEFGALGICFTSAGIKSHGRETTSVEGKTGNSFEGGCDLGSCHTRDRAG